MPPCCSGGNVVLSSLWLAYGAQQIAWWGYGIKYLVSGCTCTLHVLLSHVASSGSNSPKLPTHCSLPSADLRTQLPLPGNLPTTSNRLLQSPIIKCLASLPASNSPQHLFQHLALFSASPMNFLSLPFPISTPFVSAQNNRFPQHTHTAHSPAN